MSLSSRFADWWRDRQLRSGNLIISRIIPPGTIYCECKPIYENKGVPTDMRDPDGQRADVLCDACQKSMKDSK
jgi:hypothetical protein